MPLNITKASDTIEVKAITLTIYSQPGLGKTSLAFTASRPLLLDFDKGAHRAMNRKDVVQVSDWVDVAGIRADDLEPYDTVVIDTAGKALDVLAQDIIRKNSRHAYGGALNQQGWGQLGVRFGAFLRHLKSFGKDVVMIAHMDEQKDGDAIRERLKIQGGSKDAILTDSDVIARISIFNKERHLIFSPTETAFGKDPAQIGSMPVPDARHPSFAQCLDGIISATKDKMNAISDEQLAYRIEVDWFREKLPGMKTPDEINAVLGRARKAGVEASNLVVARAGEMGLEFDADRKQFVDLETFDPHGADAVEQGDAHNAAQYQ